MVLCNKVRNRWLRCLGCAAVVCCCVAGPVRAGSKTGTRTAARRVELTPWEKAERGRETLEAIPEESRTKTDYALALDGFRAVYHGAPQDVHAPSAVYAVAELLAEQGRGLHDVKSLKAAVGQYEFLRTQYPGSSLRVGALLAEAQIYANDLGDAKAAREKYALLVKQYPRSGMAEEAQAGLAALDEQKDSGGKAVAGKTPSGKVDEAGLTGEKSTSGAGRNLIGLSDTGAGAPSTVPMAAGVDATAQAAPVAGVRESGANSSEPVVLHEAAGSHDGRTGAKRHGGLAQVTGIRHWSTPNYTRVAIDLGDDVTYEAARVPNPDRIYFDLHGTQLARELVGKSFAVTDDGFLKKIRAAQFSNDMTRVVLDVNDVTEYSAFLLPNPYRLIIDIHGGSKVQSVAGVEKSSPAAGVTPGAVAGAEAAVEVPAPRVAVAVKSTQARPVPNTVSSKSTSTTEIAALSAQPGRVDATSMPTSQPISAVVKDQEVAVASAPSVSAVAGTSLSRRTKKGRAGKVVDPDAVPARAAVPTADGQTSLVRALGLKIGRIVIDAGHGGHDSGTLGVDGIEEKDVVLDVALRLGKVLHDRLGAEVVYTRSDDTFIPLETRTAIANKAQADLFLSIHANSSSDATARGVETYYLNFTSSPDALETAARENAVSDQSIHQLSDLVKKIALKDKISESREFASDVEESLYGGLQRGNAGLKNRGVKKAPFVVLIGANMPSILAEISFVTNPKDAHELQQPEYRQRVAESLYKGVAKYAGGLSGVKAPTERASVK
jgi:N-acetylmuramoyl-L-alanine amidase